MKPEELNYGDERKTEKNKIETMNYGDVRKPKLTLMVLNKLRKIRELKKLEWSRKKELFAKMYGNPAQDEQPPGMM